MGLTNVLITKMLIFGKVLENLLAKLPEGKKTQTVMSLPGRVAS